MAIVGVPGWIGSSAVDETGERWMAQAGAKVRLTTPFYMSRMAGQSVYNINFTVYERYYNNARYRGQWGVGWYSPYSKPSGHGAVGGSFNGNAFGTVVSAQSGPDISVITIQNGPAVNLRLTMDDGGVFDFNNNGRVHDGYRQYQISSGQTTAWYDYLNARVGQNRSGLVTQR
ncbi:putative distal long tail fiber assembly catalyst [Cronobacter phage vB_CsaM_Cronuts]|nr:putative distal long tail fiber assembly catalyst [Cronobacter phage vB_CsaM_Cronuts]